MAEMMVGGTLKVPARAASPGGEVVLEVSGLSAPSPNLHGMALKGVSFEVRRGEVLGIGGVAGNGQDELLLALSGELRTAPGMVRLRVRARRGAAARPNGGRAASSARPRSGWATPRRRT
jgi:simple sugar transport system ATP-binding protein